MRLILVLAFVVAIAGLLYVLLSAWLAARTRRDGPWRVHADTRADGAVRVVVLRDGTHGERVVQKLPPGIDPIELASKLRLAREDARLLADELNRSGPSDPSAATSALRRSLLADEHRADTVEHAGSRRCDFR